MRFSTSPWRISGTAGLLSGPFLFQPFHRSANARNAAAVLAPIIGLPWPLARTLGSSRAIARIDSAAARWLQVVYHGGPDRPGRCSRRPEMELSFIVTTASPLISTWSRRRNYARWPGV